MFKLAIVVPARSAAAFSDALEDFGESVSGIELAPDGDWRVEAVGPEPDRAKLQLALALAAASQGVPEPDVEISPLPERDWLRENLKSFRPISAGRFFVHPSHDRPHAPGRIAICIDAGEAFGTGEHETTRVCLLAIDALTPRIRPRRALDMGCGSGVLAIAMARTWRIPVLAVDLAPEAARVAAANARLNGVADLVTACHADGYRGLRGRFGLIAANILQNPLMAMAPALARCLERGGRAILSGFYVEQAPPIVAAHRAQGLVLERKTKMGAWCALQFRKP